MSDVWFVQRDEKRYGPYSPAQMKQMTTTGQLLPVDLVSRGEGSKWVPASQIKGLFNVAPATQPPPLTTGVVPPVPAASFDFGGPPPIPVATPAGGAAVEIVDRKAIPTNPVAMALLSGLILIPVGHILMGQVLKAVVVLFAAPWLMVSLGFATGGLGLPVVLLAYAAIMGADAYLLALKRSAGEPVGPWDTPVVGKLLGAKGLLPARIAMPILGMLLVVGSGLCLSLFGVKVALFDDSDIRNQLLIAFSLFHCVFAVVAIVLTARLQYSLAAPVAAVLTMTAWGWYCFATIPPIASILGLMAGISIGAWALFTFRSPDVKAMFADGGKPGPLDRFGTPVLAGAAGGLLAVILGLGGVLYMVARDKTNPNHSASSGSGGTGDRQMKERTMPEPRQMKSRSGEPLDDDDDPGMSDAGREVTDAQLKNRSLAQIKQLLGAPTEIYQSRKRPNQKLAIWATGNDKYAVVGYLESIDGSNQFIILTTAVNRTSSTVESMKKASDK